MSSETGSSVASGAASGAAMGTMILPGWGTAIGAAAGAVGGIFTASAQRKAEKRKFEQQKQMNQLELRQSTDETKQKIITNLAQRLASTFKGAS